MGKRTISGLSLSERLPTPTGRITVSAERVRQSLLKFFGGYLRGVARLECPARISGYICLDTELFAGALRLAAEYAYEKFIPTVTLTEENSRLYVRISPTEPYDGHSLARICSAATAAGLVVTGSDSELCLYTELISLDAVQIYAISDTDFYGTLYRVFFLLGN
ncbi:MAG: hypothetical protein IKA64_02760 [Clostridia bacterium]|nr:hypothetical protein [Clostridia bacterium]